MANKCFLYGGKEEWVSPATVERKRGDAYRAAYEGQPPQRCRGCGNPAQGSSHTISQQRCKQLHHSEWIWAQWNFWPACHRCNSAWESNDSSLINYNEC